MPHVDIVSILFLRMNCFCLMINSISVIGTRKSSARLCFDSYLFSDNLTEHCILYGVS